MLCINCIQSILPSLQSKYNQLDIEGKTYIQNLQRYIDSNHTSVTENFIGHCCMIQQHYNNKEQPKRKYTHRKKSNNLKQDRINDDMTIGGCFCLPEFQLLIPTKMNCMDVMGLGAEKTHQLKGKWHFVVDELKAEAICNLGVYPNTKIPLSWKVYEKEVNIQTPHSYSNKRLKKKRVSIKHLLYLKLLCYTCLIITSFST